jgi:AcrR family transcriptional regulator
MPLDEDRANAVTREKERRGEPHDSAADDEDVDPIFHGQLLRRLAPAPTRFESLARRSWIRYKHAVTTSLVSNRFEREPAEIAPLSRAKPGTVKEAMKTAQPKLGLRERKKLATRLAISDVATHLFIERGFDKVTVAEVAEAANVSVNTIFNYFATKEELFFDRAEEVIEMPSRIVRERLEGESAIEALRRCYRDGIRQKGLLFAASPSIARFMATIEASPALKAHERTFANETERRLVQTLIDETGAKPNDPTARAVAAMVVGLTTMLVLEHRGRVLRGEPEATARPALLRIADRGFALLISGAGKYAVRPKSNGAK